MFITPAFAQGSAPGGDLMQFLLPFAFIIPIFYFLVIRPQQMRQKQHREVVTNIRRGDTVVLANGFIGKVTKVTNEQEIEVELSENMRLRVVRSTVQDVRSKGEPVKDGA